ncbi:hypothetical protein D6D54_08450 [Spiroplasma poulsonii]|uniref:Uncharacterized protein n=1 Tax=Spiroplasma poulsonii TaxID=2138 RepID=A0A433EMK4_9MOLU|nr:hypothetical protein [Spiroplasma poulsonii]MBW3059460.1 hypothetical protein [Spiroplasma poulsonii]MBW3059476.1 hypothetical protein [Spiroplasma poulsonii]RUP75522.1 hypothetical protein D6D54_08450 [Spiroplasma poulsonii]
MKKILSLLSVLTISGTAIPTTIAASPYQKEENIKDIVRFKRNIHPSRLDVKYDWSSTWNKMIATFSPSVINDIWRYKSASNNFDEFKAIFKVGMFSGIWKDHRVTDSYIDNLAMCIWNNWGTIDSVFNQTGKNCSAIIDLWASNGSFISAQPYC